MELQQTKLLLLHAGAANTSLTQVAFYKEHGSLLFDANEVRNVILPVLTYAKCDEYTIAHNGLMLQLQREKWEWQLGNHQAFYNDMQVAVDPFKWKCFIHD